MDRYSDILYVQDLNSETERIKKEIDETKKFNKKVIKFILICRFTTNKISNQKI